MTVAVMSVTVIAAVSVAIYIEVSSNSFFSNVHKAYTTTFHFFIDSDFCHIYLHALYMFTRL